jgi:hypothetical protein
VERVVERWIVSRAGYVGRWRLHYEGKRVVWAV